MDQYRRGELVFDVIDEGPADGPVVVLLHGFSQFNTSWNAVIARLTAGGYRCLAPNQRGFSRGARPTRRRDYRLPELVEDVRALIDASGAQRVHLVGHDWGAAVAWAVAAEIPERLASLTTMSVPHPVAFLKSMATSRQALASWYIFFFQLPRIPERYFLAMEGMPPGCRNLCSRWPSSPVKLLTAMPAQWPSPECSPPPSTGIARSAVGLLSIGKITVPTMYLWSDADTAQLERVPATLSATSAASTASRCCTVRTGCLTSSPTQ